MHALGLILRSKHDLTISSSGSCGAAEYVPRDARGSGLFVQLSVELKSRSRYTLPYSLHVCVYIGSVNQTTTVPLSEGTHEPLAMSPDVPNG